MEEIRVNPLDLTPEEQEKSRKQAELVFKINHTMPFAEEYASLVKELFKGKIGKNSRVMPPLTCICADMVSIGDNVVVMNNCLMMSRGTITIEDGALIAANAQLISNNHDLYERHIITCKPVRICKNAWIGAGATILPGVTVGENAVVGAGSVVTKDVAPNTIVAGNPARLVKQIPPYELKNMTAQDQQTEKDLLEIKQNFNHLSFAAQEDSAKLLDKAALICVTKHQDQRDKMGCAYFQHPMRVAMRCATDDEKIVALLHDTIEDTDVTPEYLLCEGFPQYIVDAILSVTKKDGESYEDFVARAKENPIGRQVKIHDLEDNLNVMRLDEVSPGMAARFTKYLKAIRTLKELL